MVPGLRFDKVACTEHGCNFVAEVNENIGTTCGYFRYCPECGREGTLNNWTVIYVDGKEKQYIRGSIVG